MRRLLKADMTVLELLEELHRDIEKLDKLYQATRTALADCIRERRRLYRGLAVAGLTAPDPDPATDEDQVLTESEVLQGREPPRGCDPVPPGEGEHHD